MCEYDDKRSITVANIVETQWLSRYPWPTQVTLDRGSEFIGQDFKDMIKNDYGIKRKPITVRNPQANAIWERVHQVLGNMVRTFELEDHYVNGYDINKDTITFTVSENQRKRFAKHAVKQKNHLYWITQIFLPRNIKKYEK